jgi:hypothetical protein
MWACDWDLCQPAADSVLRGDSLRALSTIPNTAGYVPTMCSMYRCSGFMSILTTALSSSTSTWVSAEVDNSSGKRPWPPPSQVQVFSEQGMHRLVANLLDAKSDVIWSKPPWPPPHMQVEFECGSDDIRPFPWPSFTTVVLELAIWMSYTLPRKPPWPPPAHQYFRTMHAETVEIWKHMTVLTEWSLHVLIQENLGLFRSSRHPPCFYLKPPS